jgi:hypothetical protein
MKMEVIYSSETLVTTYKITWCHNQWGHKPHINCYEYVKPQKNYYDRTHIIKKETSMDTSTMQLNHITTVVQNNKYVDANK